MNVESFVNKYWQYAMKSQIRTGIPALAVMAQAALETGWGSTVIGNMMFGKKDNDGLNGNEQLLLTTEYLDNPNAHFPEVVLITKIRDRLYKYKVRDWFRKYSTPAESFIDHSLLISKSKRYETAMLFTDKPFIFATEIARAGYATDPDYAAKLSSIMKTIQKYV